MNEARIKLAEAMGWEWDESIRPRDFEGYPGWCCWVKPDGDKWFAADAMPDPENDANDDYAVLEWVRKQIFSKRMQFSAKLGEILQNIENEDYSVAWPDAVIRYQTGDYARAALTLPQFVEDSGN